MSKRRGLSMEEKRTVVLGLFHESNTAWLLKDMEKAATKAGVVQQTVKDVVQSLIDDDMVSMDKIGTSNFYWSLKTEHANKIRKKQATLAAEHAAATTAHAELSARVAEAKAARPDTADRAQAVAALAAAQERHAALTAECAKHAASDPEVIARIAGMKKSALEAANRWTDNLFAIKDWVVKKGMAASDFASFVKSRAEVNIETYEYLTEEAVMAKNAKGAKKAGGAKSGGAKSGGASKKRKAAEVEE